MGRNVGVWIGAGGDAVCFEQGVERRTTDTEELGGGGEDAVAAGQGFLQDLALGAHAGGAQIEVVLVAGAGGEFEIASVHLFTIGHDDAAFEAVFEFADVAGPGVAGDRGEGFLGEAAQVAVEFAVEAAEEEAGEQHGVARAFAQRWNAHGDGVQAVEQIVAEAAVGDLFLKVHVGGRDDAHVDRNGGAPADAFDDLFLQETQQLDLERVRQVADFVEEEGAFVGGLDFSNCLLDGAGEGAAFVAEELRFQQVFGDGAAVDGDERLLGARAEIVQGAGEGLLAGAAFAEQEHGDVGGGEAFDGAADLQHRVRRGDDTLDRGGALDFGEAAVFVLQFVQPQGAFDDGAQERDVGGLFAEIIGAGGDGTKRVHAVAVAGGDDDLEVGVEFDQRVEGGEAFRDAVGVGRQAEIDDGGGRAVLGGGGNGGGAGARGLDVGGGEGPAVLAGQALVILDNQQSWLAHERSCRRIRADPGYGSWRVFCHARGRIAR